VLRSFFLFIRVLGWTWELTGHREPGQNLHKAGKYMPISTLTRYKSKKKVPG